MQNRDTHLIWEAYANNDRLLNENFINKLKEKFGNFTAETVAPYVREALQKLKQEDSKTYNEIGAAVKNNDLNALKKIVNANGIHQEGVLDDLKAFGKEGGKSLVAGAKEAGKMAYSGIKKAVKGGHDWLGKKLGQGKRGLLYILMIAITLLAVTNQKPVEYEPFNEIVETEMVISPDFDDQVEDLNKSTKNLEDIGKEIDSVTIPGHGELDLTGAEVREGPGGIKTYNKKSWVKGPSLKQKWLKGKKIR